VSFSSKGGGKYDLLPRWFFYFPSLDGRGLRGGCDFSPKQKPPTFLKKIGGYIFQKNIAPLPLGR
jgi:hypothetical protein